MRYELDANGYVLNVFWGCYSGNCAEYTGTVPSGYTDLNDWSENALINAYYLDEKGNLMLDPDRLADLQAKIEEETIDNEPLVKKDLYGTSNVMDSQYKSAKATGLVITIDNVKKLNPIVKITNIDCYESSKLDVITQGKNMLRNDAVTETIGGVTFTKLISGGIKISGTSTEAIEYNLSGSSTNTTSLFALKKNKDYYLNIGGLDCEMKYYDGTTNQVYVGASGLINLSESKQVTQVLIKIPSGTTINQTIYPMLECGSFANDYEEYKVRKLTIDFSKCVKEGLFPSNDLFPSDDLFPTGTIINYIYIENGSVYVSVDGVRSYLMKANVNLFDGYNNVYTMQDTNLEMTYYTNELKVDDLGFLQGKSTTTNKFKVLDDGSIEAHNGSFSGDIYLNNGGKVIGGDGLYGMIQVLGNIKSQQFLGASIFMPLYFNEYSGTKDQLEFDFDIPNNFKIEKAFIKLEHMPLEHYTMTETGKNEMFATGYCRNLKLYKGTILSNSKATINWDFGGFGYSNVTMAEVSNAFGTSGFTGLASGYTTENSIDIKDSISTGSNILIVQTGDSLGTFDYAKYGSVRGTLYIYGYTNKESESDN